MNPTASRLDQIIARLRSLNPERIYLFGSWARGEEDALSDVDLVMIQDTELGFFERLKAAARLLPASLGGIDLLIYTPEEFERMRRSGNAFADLIEKEGRLLYVRAE